MSVKRYDVFEAYGMVRQELDPYGDWVRAEDFDRVRRRLVVKLLRERADNAYWHCGEQYNRSGQARCRSVSRWCKKTADAIERGERLGYFERLGEDK